MRLPVECAHRSIHQHWCCTHVSADAGGAPFLDTAKKSRWRGSQRKRELRRKHPTSGSSRVHSGRWTGCAISQTPRSAGVLFGNSASASGETEYTEAPVEKGD